MGDAAGTIDPFSGSIRENIAFGRPDTTEDEIIEFCRQNLAHYKVPQIIEFRGELPKTDVGKISRRELREEAEEV